MRSIAISFAIGVALYVAFVITTMIAFPDRLETDAAIYVGASLAAGLVVLVPMLAQGARLDPFSPLTVILFTVALGASVRAPYLATEYLTSPAARYQMLGYEFSDIAGSVFWYVIGVLALMVGYSFKVGRIPLERVSFLSSNRINPKRLLIVAILFGFVGLVGVLSYIQVHNISLGDGLASLSGKRAVIIGSEDGAVYGAGWQTFVGQTSKYAFAVIALLIVLKKVPTNPFWMGLSIALGFLSFAIPFLGNTRSAIALLGINLIIALYYFGKLKIKTILIWSAVSLVMISALTELRAQNQGRANIHGNAVDAVLGSGNGLDAYRTALILEVAPDRVGYQYGRSLLAVGAGVVPRAIWPDKPAVAMGPWVKEKIFGHGVRNNGWPPGIIAEGFLNFSYLGLMLFPLLYGCFLRLYYESFRPLLGRSVFGTLCYAFALYPLAFTAVSNNISLGVVAMVVAIAPLLGFAAIAHAKPRMQNRGVQIPGMQMGPYRHVS